MKWIEGVDPRVKLLWCLLLLFTALFTPYIVTELAILVIVFFTDLIFTGNLKKYKVLLVLFLVVASQIYLMQILFNREGTVIAQWWIFSLYSEAIPTATLGTLRTMAISFAAIQMLSWTSADDAVLMFISWKVPYRYAMLISMAQRFFPLLKDEYNSITESQAVRGVPTDGVKNKIKVLPTTFLPFLYRAIRHTSDIALSMELRGFGKTKQRTFMKELHLSRGEILVMVLFVLLFLVTHFYFHI